MIARPRCSILVPLGVGVPWMAIETARAGGIGLLDAEHVRHPDIATATAAVRWCLDHLPMTSAPGIGLRLRASDLARYRPALSDLASRPHWVVLTDWEPTELRAQLTELAADREVWLEVGGGAEVAAVDAGLPFHGWAGRGAECGGVTGDESAFVLAQRLARLGKPFLIRGGIGVHSAAACAVAGAHAVILDDVVHLLRESVLPPRWRHLVERLGLTNTARVGADLGRPVRTLRRPDADGSTRLLARAELLARQATSEGRAAWQQEVAERLAWGEPETTAWPVGEGIGLARATASRYQTTARLVSAVTGVMATHVRPAAAQSALAEGGPLASRLGTRYPIVQGPMTRVSDTAAFASAVAVNGGLPLVALALMREPEARALLTSTRNQLAGAPWGVGILGFVPADLRREQLAVLEQVRPSFALIAGGLPEQVAALDAAGIATFLHAPAPLLRPFLQQGVRRFVLEGGECGGHIGPLHSFTLWDYAVETLSTSLGNAECAATQVLFAGGIHDDRSAAMVAALAAPLAARGIQWGVLMGTAYLFTGDAVTAGAITPSFQREVVQADRTVTIETGPGHVIRCAATPFTTTFAGERRALAASGVSGEALSAALDQLIVGRARVASKGVVRDGDRLVPVDEAHQRDEGLFMLGEAAVLRDRPTSIADLHARVSAGGQARLDAVAASGSVEPATVAPAVADVAIVGAACLVPGARDLDAFWRNLLDGRGAIAEIPRERWDWRLYYDPQPGARDRILSRWGGFVDPIPFDPIRFGIPPASLRSITPSQLIALELTRRALLDAGYEHARPPADVRERTAVVFAIGNTGDFEQMYMTRAGLPLAVGTVDESVRERLPEWTEESYPGLLPSVTAGRVANRFDFGGPNLTIDAACASSLAALDVAVRELVDRRSDVVVAGGLDFEMSPQAFMGFSHTRALSPRGRADVFDRGADGIVISEGAVVLILKRLADAERDGDRVYAVIKGVAGSSDGRGLSMTAPKPAGQRLALTRAYARSGIDPGTLRLYEAHGTGTALGDAAEAQTITRLLTGAGAPEAAVAIGSAKSLVGHTRTAAGMVALLKAALALHHRVLPPHGGVSAPLAEVSDGPLALHREPRPWTAERGVPRRAGASAFGFGGTNFHVILEEHQREVGEAPVGAPVWPIELLVLAAPDAPGLQRALDRLDRAAERLQAMPADGSVPVPFTLRDLAYVAATEARNSGAHRVALVASSADELRARIAEARLALDGTPAAAGGVFVGAGAPAGSLGWLFPGQGSQHPGMGREAATYLADLRTAVEQVEQVMGERAVSVSRLMWPRAAFNPADEEASRRRLADTIVAQPAIGALSCGLADVLTRLGLAPAAVAGHSFGEFVALHAAGCLDRDALLTLAVERGRAMAAVGPDAGTMAMLAGDADAAAGWIHGLDGIVVANRNAPGQVVVSGTREAVQAAMARARADGRAATPLTVSGAFHSPLMKPARAALTDAIERVRFHSPRVPVFGNVDGRTYPVDEAAIASRLRQHLEDPVNFVDQIESMYAAGVRTFVEVGPGRVLTGLVRRILGDRPAVALATDGGLRALLEAVGALHAHGHAPDVVALFAGRPVRWVDFDRLPDLPSTPRDWWVDGARAWPATAAMPTTGAAPFVTADTLPHPSAVSGLPALPVVEQPEAALVSFYRTYEETMRRFLDQQERMLEQVLHLARGGHTMPATVVEAAPLRPGAALPAPAAPRREPATSEGRTANAMAARLVRILGERTGYTEDAIGLEYDLEADLGVDSIKRIEMIATFASSFPEDDARRLQASLDRLTRLRTLNAIAAAASAALADDVAAPAPASAAILSCPRLVVQLEERPVPANQREIAGFHLITEDALGVSPLVAKALADRGVPVAIVTLDDLRDESRLFERVSEWRRQFGPVRGVVHLTPLGRPPMADGEWEPELNATVRTLFSLLKLAANDLAGSPDGGRAFGAVLAATALGGTWGRDRCHAGAEIAGGCHGLLRSFAREYETVRTLVVDLDDRAAPPELAQHVMQEFATAADQEVGYREGRRRVPNLVDSPIRPDARVEHWRLESGSVVLATGGTRGITAEVCHAVAGPGVRFVLIGRPDTGAPNAERRQVVDRLTAAGAAVEIIGVDVADAAAFGAVIDDVYRRYGRIDGVLHGAGHIHDQRFELKSTAGYAEVFRAKVGGAFTLARHLKPDTVRWCVFFSSVSGRFGNAGQSDYAAANEILNRLAWSLHRRWGTARVVSINWGPWSGAGMLTASTLALVQSRGFQPIVPEAGRRFAREEIGAGSSADVEVIAGMPPSRGSTPPRG